MNIYLIVNKLIDLGFSKRTLAEKLTKAGIVTNTSTIHRMSASESYRTGSDKTIFLYDLYREAITAEKLPKENHPSGGESL